jgi:uncharacterized flavoprotein (TIGR03862 family)
LPYIFGAGFYNSFQKISKNDLSFNDSESIAIAHQTRTAMVIGGGPAGLMAAQTLLEAGLTVGLYDAMPSLGRKFLLAGKGGLNLTHAEPIAPFLARYTSAADWVEPMIRTFDPQAIREWAAALGVATFVGSSQRVFPLEMKAAPLLRAWLHRLRGAGLTVHTRHRWIGWDAANHFQFTTPIGPRSIRADVVVLALGGASWARLGSDGAWVAPLASRGIAIAPLTPANCGFDVAGWSAHLRDRFAGAPLKAVTVTFRDTQGSTTRRGEFVVTASGLEGSLIYAFAARLRDAMATTGVATIYLDLAPDRDAARLREDLASPRGTRSMANHLRARAGIDGVKAALLREIAPAAVFEDINALAALIKALPIRLIAPRPIDEAISTAGGITRAACDEHLMLRDLPGVFVAGEMLDWEAPTGGYLLTACLATGRAAGRGAARWALRGASP